MIFRNWVLQNFPFLEDDFDALTDYELFCKMVEYMKKSLEKIDLYDEKLINFNNRLTELENYINNLDLQDEVNNKLDEMVQDGTFDEIINQEIFGELNDKVDNLQQTFDDSIGSLAYNNIFLGTFFDETNEVVHFLTSLDGQNWSEFNKDVTIGGRDPQLIYNSENKTFYLCLTQSSGVNYDFICYTSTDFTTWTQNQVDLGLHSGTRWAPELFIDDNDDMYALISCGTSTSDMQIYISKCTDIDNLTFSNARLLNLSLTNVIDASMIKYNNTYYLTVKDNDTAKQIIYTSSDLITFTSINSDIVGNSVPCEGGQLLNINDRWYFYGDTWHSYGNYGVMQTDDINDFGYIICNKSLKYMRHGSVLYLNDKEAVNLITQLPSYSNITRIIEDNSQILLSGTIDNLVVYPNYMYRINDDTTINNINNPYNLQFMPFAFTTAIGKTLTVTLGTGRTKVLTNTTATNEKLQFINLQGDKYSTGTVKKTISASDLWTVNDDTQYEVALYTSTLIDNRLHLVFGMIKKVENITVEPLTFKAPYRPVGVCGIMTDTGNTHMYIRHDGTMQNGGYLTKDQFTYCYCDFEIE